MFLHIVTYCNFSLSFFIFTKLFMKVWKYSTIPALVMPFISSIFYTYILKNFFDTISDSLYYSARIDGASNWMYLWRIMVPIPKPSLGGIKA
ncbi:MAG: ABC transporter permease subunit [Treponema sp.]|nr:ABC transporter permease subunit [Treponema sp.]